MTRNNITQGRYSLVVHLSGGRSALHRTASRALALGFVWVARQSAGFRSASLYDTKTGRFTTLA